MRDRQNPNLGCRLDVNDLVGKANHCTATNGQIGRDARNSASGLRHGDEAINSGVNGIEELIET